MSTAIGPTNRVIAATGNVSGDRSSQRAVHSGIAFFITGDRTASPHPGPFSIGAERRIELPQVIEKAIIAVGIVTAAAKEPKVAAAVGPTHSSVPSSGDVTGSRRSHRAVHSRSASGWERVRAASAYPCPLVCRRIELPQVVQLTHAAGTIAACTSKKPEMAAVVSPFRGVRSASGNVSGGRRPQGAVHSRITTAGNISDAASALPGPFICDGTELPHVV